MRWWEFWSFGTGNTADAASHELVIPDIDTKSQLELQELQGQLVALELRVINLESRVP